MIRFLKKYTSLWLIAFPLITLAGVAFPALGLGLALVFGVIFLIQGRRGHLVFFYLGTLIFADSREPLLAFYQSVRIELLFLLVFWTLADLNRRRYSLKRSFLWIVPFLLLSFFSLVFFSPIKFLSFQRTVSYALVVFVSFHFLPDWLYRGGKKAFTELLSFMGWVFGLGLIGYVLVPDKVMLGNRFEGIFGNPNGIGLTSLVMLPFLVFGYKWFPNIRIPWYFIFGLFFAALLLSRSRNGLFSCIIFLGLYWTFINSWRRVSFFVFLPLIALVIVNVDWVEVFTDIGLGEYLRVEGLYEASGRTVSWAYALTHIPDHFWLGAGFSYDFYLYQIVIPPELDVFREMSSTWNTYLSLMLSNGLIGTLAFLLFVLRQPTYAKSKPEAWAFTLAMLLGAIFETWLTASLNSFTIYFYWMLAFLQHRKLP